MGKSLINDMTKGKPKKLYFIEQSCGKYKSSLVLQNVMNKQDKDVLYIETRKPEKVWQHIAYKHNKQVASKEELSKMLNKKELHSFYYK